MKKKLLVVLLLMLLSNAFNPLSYAGSQTILGQKSQAQKVEVGNFLFHFRDLYDKDSSTRNMHTRPSLVISHKGWVGSIFNNSHDQNAVVLGIERNWNRFPLGKGLGVFGYRLGAMWGYCIEKKFEPKGLYVRCRKPWETEYPETRHMILPMGQLFFDYRHKSFGISIATTFLVVTASAIINY